MKKTSKYCYKLLLLVNVFENYVLNKQQGELRVKDAGDEREKFCGKI